jgi:hypothetical protein
MMLKPPTNQAGSRPMIRTIYREASMCEMQAFGDSYNAAMSVPVVEDHDSRLTHASSGTSPSENTSAVLTQRETRTSHMLTFTLIDESIRAPCQPDGWQVAWRNSHRCWSVSLGCQRFCPSIANVCSVHSRVCLQSFDHL